jgi:hypothetical protein
MFADSVCNATQYGVQNILILIYIQMQAMQKGLVGMNHMEPLQKEFLVLRNI